jgi:hypothetical protein
VNGWAAWEDWREDKGVVDASDSAVARVDERPAVVNAAVVASTSVNGDGGGSTGVGANVT